MCKTQWKGEGRKMLHKNRQIIYKEKDTDTQHGAGFILRLALADFTENIKNENKTII